MKQLGEVWRSCIVNNASLSIVVVANYVSVTDDTIVIVDTIKLFRVGWGVDNVCWRRKQRDFD